MITLEEYRKAEEIIKNYRVCSGYCGHKILKVEDAQYTIQYGNQHWWCKECYDKVKNDW